MEHVAPRYRSEDYARIREIMDDGKKMPASFLGWKEAADRQLAVAKARGVVTKTVTIDLRSLSPSAMSASFQEAAGKELHLSCGSQRMRTSGP
jgi:hypothetical protein